ncbi:uncharacterized protein LOC116424160 isoform X2 [Nomia melanderi]|nr:uncharacterized protein LOC116424160 isoform X2 [Nomia melanderi]
MLQIVLCAILILHGDVSLAKPLDPEDLEGLLPPTPQDKNETIAAIVQDPVVQDAVQQTASNSSLNGLVVKRKVYILPANDPNKILSAREHILVVPTENLEDVRKNITEAKQAEVESSSMDSQLLVESDTDDYMPQSDAIFDSQENENAADLSPSSIPEANVEQIPVNKNQKIDTKFLEDKLSQYTPAPDDESKKMAVPIVAVIDPSTADKGKVNAPIVAILPNQLSSNTLNNHVQFLAENSDKIQNKAQSFVDQSSLTVNPDYWKSSTTASEITIVPSTQEAMQVSLLPEGSSNLVNEEVFLTPVAVPRWGIVAPFFPNHGEYPRDTEDMDVAEDIIFRPLFRYRQETQGRSSNRRYGYRSPSYNYYPRRGSYYGSYDDY